MRCLSHILLCLLCALALFPTEDARSSDCDPARLDPARFLFWSPREQLCGYQNMEKLWHFNVVVPAAPDRVFPLAPGPALNVPGLDAFMERNAVHGLLVLKDDTILLEKYRGGLGPDTRWTSFSMAKSITSILVGAALKDGSIKSLGDPVNLYVPELKNSAYGKVTIRQLLTMTSGVAWDERYRDRNSTIGRLMGLINEDTDAFFRFMADLPEATKPGVRFNYSTGEAILIGHLVQRATGRSLSGYLSEIVWKPLGMEREAIWITDRAGHEYSGCCFSATLRDYGRLGAFMLAGGVSAGVPRLPDDWIKESTRPSIPSLEQSAPYGYQWWIRDNGSYQASGIFGQMLHIDPRRNLVIVLLGAWTLPTGAHDQQAERRAFVDEVKVALDASNPQKP